jgi:hypothetical protein
MRDTSGRQRRLLIVCPRFPPVSAADAQRTRALLPLLPEAGWEPWVLACAVEDADGAREPEVCRTILPPERLRRVQPVPAAWSRVIGIGGLGWRARAAVDSAFREWHAEHRFDVVFFSNTEFSLWPLGMRWRRDLGVPFVLDWQDPWINDHYAHHPRRDRPGGRLKFAVVQWLARRAEPGTVRAASGHVAVSSAYPAMLRARYPDLQAPIACVPFPFDGSAMQRARNLPEPWRPAAWGRRPWVYVGRGGEDMHRAVSLFGASLALCAARSPASLEGVTVHLVGTDYAPRGRARPTLRDALRSAAPWVSVHEHPHRIGFDHALRLMDDAELVLAFGSDDPMYNPSKIAACLAARPPVCGLFHEASDVHARCAGLPGVALAAFGSGESDAAVAELAAAIPYLLGGPRSERAVADFDPRVAARRVAEVIDAAVAAG